MANLRTRKTHWPTFWRGFLDAWGSEFVFGFMLGGIYASIIWIIITS